MKPLTSVQRRALFLAKQKGGAPVSGPRKQPDGTREIPKGHIGPYTARWLIAVGYALRPDKVLLITDAGRKAYNAPIPPGLPVLLACGGGIKYRTLPNGRQVVRTRKATTPSPTTATRRRTHTPPTTLRRWIRRCCTRTGVCVPRRIASCLGRIWMLPGCRGWIIPRSGCGSCAGWLRSAAVLRAVCVCPRCLCLIVREQGEIPGPEDKADPESWGGLGWA
jgi:hypothetical protein